MFAPEFNQDRTGALTVGLVDDGRLEWTKGYGFINRRSSVPASADTVYGIAWVTKIFTGIMLLQLVERGKVHLTDRVKAYLPKVNLIPTKYSLVAADHPHPTGDDDRRAAATGSAHCVTSRKGTSRAGCASIVSIWDCIP